MQKAPDYKEITRCFKIRIIIHLSNHLLLDGGFPSSNPIGWNKSQLLYNLDSNVENISSSP
jgi:hypothetical protein